MRCGRCGRENPNGAVRCAYCNTPFQGVYRNVNMPNRGAQQIRPVQGRPMQGRPVQGRPMQGRPVQRPVQKNTKKQYSTGEKGIFISIIALVLIFAMLVGIYSYQSCDNGGGGFSGGGGGGGFITSTPEPENNGDFSLQASKREFDVNSKDNAIYFYATPEKGTTTVELTDKEGNVVAQMKDDGQYKQSGDDLQDDGVFSAIVKIDTKQEKTFYYTAKAGEKVSNAEKINVIALLTDTELNNIDKVNGELATLRESESYKGYGPEERKKFILERLQNLGKEGFVILDSIRSNDEDKNITFYYESGVMGIEMLEDESDIENGFNTSKSDYVIDNLAKTKGEKMGDIKLGRAKILYATDNTSSWRYKAIKKTKSLWTDAGVETDVDSDVTIEDMKNLKGNDFVFVDAHGGYGTFTYTHNEEYTWYYEPGAVGSKSFTAPAVCLLEKSTKKKNQKYSAALKSGKVILVGGEYAIVPAFFTEYYSNTDLEESIFFWSCCEFMGSYGTVVEQWPNALTKLNVAATIGYHNSVYALYAYYMANHTMARLIAGDTIKEAFDNAVSTYGSTDVAWIQSIDQQQDPFGGVISNIIERHKKEIPHAAAAYPLLRGDENATLINNTLKNGTYEESATTIKYWKKTGDVRLITKLGPITPREGSRMTILTTGVGSGESTYLNSTEGSSLYQVFRMPDDKSTVSFDYNIISEEPHEYVNSKYDDKFYAEIMTLDGKVVKTIAKETVNSSKWSPISGINFDGGDSTTYETGWKSQQADLSAYKGQVLVIRFVVFDVGDSAYDTAAVVDNVVLK